MGEKGKGGKGGKKKTGGFKTVSSGYREQLNNLLITLNATSPHFIRCIVPNETKSPGVTDAALIMHQLTCNGVLEGIRICQLGLPNRMIYADFKQRYKILGAKFFSTMGDQEAVKATFDDVGLDPEKYRVGATKVFFRAGVLGEVEEIRDDVIGKMVQAVQNQVRGWYGRRKYRLLQEQRIALTVVQRNVRKYMGMKTWQWFHLWVRVKPLIGQPRLENAIEDMKEEVERTGGKMQEHIAHQQEIQAQKDAIEKELAQCQKQFEQTQDAKNKLLNQKKSTEGDAGSIQRDLEDLDMNLQRACHDRDNKDHQIRNLQDELTRQEEIINKINKEKKQLQDVNAKNSEVFGDVEGKAQQLNKLKQQLERTVDEINESINREKKGRNDIEKATRKIQGDIKITQE